MLSCTAGFSTVALSILFSARNLDAVAMHQCTVCRAMGDTYGSAHSLVTIVTVLVKTGVTARVSVSRWDQCRVDPPC